jgi:hypothetical protein
MVGEIRTEHESGWAAITQVPQLQEVGHDSVAVKAPPPLGGQVDLFAVRCFSAEMSSPVEAVQAQVDGFNARDAAAFTACYHPEATVVGPDGNVMVEGSEAINALYAKVFAQSPDLHVNILARISIEDW